MNYQKRTLLLIAISTVVRLFAASSLELGNAEVYYWAFSLKLQGNYFDHPPMVAWLIRLTTGNLLLHKEVFVRLGAVISCAICTWLIFKIGKIIDSAQTGWFSALLYTASIYSSLIAGTFILPDSPQMVFWLWSILILLKISRSSALDSKSTRLWCLFGVTSGLCIMSKVHGAFLWLGVPLYILVSDRRWLKDPGVYLSVFITLTIISPIIIWNIQNDFVTYRFHSDRVDIIGSAPNAKSLVKQLFAVVLITNPINFALIVNNFLARWKGKMTGKNKDIQILLFCSLPLIAVLVFISLFRETLAHWPQPAYCTLLILPALRLTFNNKGLKPSIPPVIKVALACLVIVIGAQIIIVNYYPGTLSKEKEGLKMGSDDVTLDMYGWKEAGEKFDSLYNSDVARKIMPAGAPIIVTSWFPAAHIDFYICNKTKQQTIGIGNIFNLHQYYWMNEYKKQLKNGDNAYFIIPSNLFESKAFDEVTNRFNKYEMPYSLQQYRGGVVCRQLYFFRMIGYVK